MVKGEKATSHPDSHPNSEELEAQHAPGHTDDEASDEEDERSQLSPEKGTAHGDATDGPWETK